MENKRHHLEMIQSVITRMSQNSFTLKGWSVTLVAGVFALLEKNIDKMYFLIIYVPIILFWFLDSYYLRQERLYRNLYNKVRLKEEKEIDFNMDISSQGVKNEDTAPCKCFFSKTELWFYLTLGIISLIIFMVAQYL